MARYTESVCRLCRREGQKLFLKGDRCYSDKCSVERRAYVPGQHGQNRKKLSEYGTQLREKQKAKRFYGVMEKQFSNYFKLATKQQGKSGENLLRILESRLDNVVYCSGFGSSRAECRQLVRHGHFTVNGKKVNIPSYKVVAGDVVAIKASSMSRDKFKALLEANSARPVPAWLNVDFKNGQATVVNLPTREQIESPIEEHYIVELYSK